MKIGLILEGGAMRGMYTAGILDVFLEQNIRTDGIVGVSAGALFGVNYLSGQKGRVIRYNKRYNSDPEYMGLRPLLKEGNIVSTEYAYRKVPHELDPFDDEAFQASGVPFYAVLTDLDTALPAYHKIQSVFEQMDVLRASGSMPFVSKPVTIDEHRYLDGGISDSIPYRWLAAQGYDKLIVILTRDLSYRKKPMSPFLIRHFYKKYPELAAQLSRRHEVYNEAADTLKMWEQEKKAFVIRPSRPIKIARIEKDPEKLQTVYNLGVRDGNRALEALRSYLSESFK